MIRAIFWKELREQFAILLALAAMGTGIIVSGAVLGTLTGKHDPFDLVGYGEPARLAAIVLVAVSGLVIGAMLFAGEHENGTADYFLNLPAARWRLWIAKAISGTVLTVGMSSAFWLASLAVGVFAGSVHAGWAIWFQIVGLSSFAAGMFGSACTKLVLPACGIGIAVGPTIAGFALLIVSIAYRYFVNERAAILERGDAIGFLFATVPLAVTIFLSLLFLMQQVLMYCLLAIVQVM